MTYETVYDEGGKPETVYVKEEPDCYECEDSGEVIVFDAAGQHLENCPDCRPTPEQIAARESALLAALPTPEPCTDPRHQLGEVWCDGCAPF